MQALNRVLEWIMKMAYLNVLWIGFTIFGLIAGGVFPSTTATFSVMRKWLLGDTDIPVFKTFWHTYKSSFLKSNLLGYVLLLFGFILYIDIRIFNESPNTIINLLAIPVVGISIIFILTMFYIFPTFVHYEIKLVQVIKNSFLIMIINPLPTIIMLIGISGISFIFMKLQGLIPIFGISILAFVITMPAVHAFNKIAEKERKSVQQ